MHVTHIKCDLYNRIWVVPRIYASSLFWDGAFLFERTNKERKSGGTKNERETSRHYGANPC